jgi:cyclophilin family peptidyl-prolyl cis-trans isomerase
MCAYDPENQCASGAHGVVSFPTVRPGEPTVVASLGVTATQAAKGVATQAASSVPTVATFAKQFSSPPPFTLDPSKVYVATLHTDKGDITIALDPKSAPQTVNNFVFLADNHFYEGLTFQRVSPGFLAQAGAPNADGTGGPGYTIPDENSPLKHDRGSVAMAVSPTMPNSGGSQFYVTLNASGIPSQDGRDTVFGKVTSGIDILQALPAHTPQDQGGSSPLKIQSVTIARQ